MFFTGFADEASRNFDEQIAVTCELGWHHIEARYIYDNRNLASITDAEFEHVAEALDRAGIRINCFGSNIANWSRAPRSEADFEASKQELLAALPRLAKLGIKLVRGMSFKLTGDEQFDSPELEKIIFAKVGELVRICADHGVVYGHENCMNYGGQSYVHTMRLLDAVQSPALTLIFDTGNPVFTFNRIGAKPYTYQDAWEFYCHIKPFVSYVHIKDAVMVPDLQHSGTMRPQYVFAGEGDGSVRKIVADLLKSGYDGGFSIEPHVATVFHEDDDPADPEVKACRMRDTYIEYGRRFEKLVGEIRH